MKIAKKELLFFCVNFGLSVLIALLWFSPLNFHVFMGDDLYWIKAYHSDGLPSSFLFNVFTLYNNIGKFRPITNTLLLLSTNICQTNYDCFIGINLTFLVLNVFLISFTAYKITAKWWPTIFIASLVFILSRFSYYFILQVWGLMENFALILVLLIVLCLIQLTKKPHIKWIVFLIVLYLLIICTHERFIVLIVPLLYILLITKKYLKLTEFIFSFLILFSLPIVYILARQNLLISSFFTGTSGTNVIDTFQVSQFISFMNQAILNLIGFNVGPDYISGKNFLSAGIGGILVGLFLSGTLTILAWTYARGFKKKQNREFELVIGLIMIIGVLIIASSITIRQDYRWLYAPFAVFIVLVCLLLSKVSNTAFKYLMAIIIVISFVSVDIFYRQFVSNIYFIEGLRTVNSVKKEIIDKYSKSELSQRDIYLITGGTTDVQKWYLANDYFFKLYANGLKVNVNYFDNLDAIPINNSYSELPLVFQIKNDLVTKIPDETIDELKLKTISDSNWIIEYDFINNFSSGVLNDYSYVGTPTGRGVFLMDWQESSGPIRRMITILGPFNIRYSSIPCKKGSMLIFRAGMPYTIGDGADLYIDIVTNDVKKRITETHFKSAIMDNVVKTTEYRIPVTECSGGMIDLIFGVESLSGDSTADWITLTDVQLVEMK